MQKTNLGYVNPDRTRVSLCSVNRASDYRHVLNKISNRYLCQYRIAAHKGLSTDYEFDNFNYFGMIL